jgi:hypothetical protein
MLCSVVFAGTDCVGVLIVNNTMAPVYKRYLVNGPPTTS